MGSPDFQFPPMHRFPPFYTRQPTEATWENQVNQWSDLILKYARHHRMFRIDLKEATSNGGSELFQNKEIDRRLSFEMLQDIVIEMVRKGDAGWEGKSRDIKTQALLYWRKPAEWANLIWNRVKDLGMNNGTVVTLYEITHGLGDEFIDMDTALLLESLRELEHREVAYIFPSNEGVKFSGSL